MLGMKGRFLLDYLHIGKGSTRERRNEQGDISARVRIRFSLHKVFSFLGTIIGISERFFFHVGIYGDHVIASFL